LGALKMDNFCHKVGDFHRKSPHFSFSSLKKNLHLDNCRAKKLMPTEKTGDTLPFRAHPVAPHHSSRRIVEQDLHTSRFSSCETARKSQDDGKQGTGYRRERLPNCTKRAEGRKYLSETANFG